MVKLSEKCEIVNLEWFTACMEEGALVKVSDHHRLKIEKQVNKLNCFCSNLRMTGLECSLLSDCLILVDKRACIKVIVYHCFNVIDKA